MLQGAANPQGAPPDAGQGQGTDPSMFLSAAIQALHDAVAHDPDPQAKDVISTCLSNLLALQNKKAQAQQGPSGPTQALQGQLGGGQ